MNYSIINSLSLIAMINNGMLIINAGTVNIDIIRDKTTSDMYFYENSDIIADKLSNIFIIMSLIGPSV